MLSIIIPTYNSEQTIARCLDSIFSQEGVSPSPHSIEVIIVDQQSTDRTRDIAAEYGATVVSVEKPKFYTPPSRSRNIGAKKASGTYLYHLDADMELADKSLLKKAVELIEREKAAALVIHEHDIGEGFWFKCLALERKCYIGSEIEAARFVRRDVFERIGGYDEGVSSGEDWDIDKEYRKKGTVLYSGLFVNHHMGRINLLKQLKKKRNYSKTGQSFFEKHHISGFHITGVQLKCFLKNWKLFARHPLIGLGTLFIRFIEYSFGFIALLRKP